MTDTAGLRTLWECLVRRLPAIVFVGVYLFTCYVGTLALMLSSKFRALYLTFSGAQPPDMTREDVIVAVVLLHAGPVLLWLGFEGGLWAVARPERRWDRLRPSAEWLPAAPRLVGPLLFFVSVGAAGWSVYRGGGLENYVAWFDYNSYVYARWRLFDTLGFFEFVNLYTLVPLLGGYVMLRERRWLTTGLVAVLVGLLQYPLANRKALLTSAILIAGALYIHLYLGRAPRRHAATRWHVAIGFGAPVTLYVLYVALTLLAVVGSSARPFQSLGQAPSQPPRPKLERGQVALSLAQEDAEEVANLVRDRTRALILYTLFAPLTRTSISALAYPAVFPRWHPYYHVDLGLDIIRIGRMPDDNLVVYRVLWPGHHRGSIAAPFHFVLYSQGGMAVAVVGSLVMGLVMAVGWAPVVGPPRPTAEMAVIGGLVVTFGVFLAIDSIRNSTLVSYGLAWGVLVVLILGVWRWGASRVGGRRRGAMRTAPTARDA